MPGYYGTWYFDNLADQGSQSALAFDYQPCHFASSLYSDGSASGGGYLTTPANLVGAPDGNLGQLHASNCCSDAAWVVLDLGSTYSSGTAVLLDSYSYNNGAGAYYTHVQVFVSPDASTWTKVYGNTMSPSPANTVVWRQYSGSSPVSFRYIEVKVLDDAGYSGALWIDSVGVPPP
jgi:hypothetical protein